MNWLRPSLQEKFDEFTSASYVHNLNIQSEIHGVSKIIRICDELIELIKDEKNLNKYEEEVKETLPKYKESLLSRAKQNGAMF